MGYPNQYNPLISPICAMWFLIGVMSTVMIGCLSTTSLEVGGFELRLKVRAPGLKVSGAVWV